MSDNFKHYIGCVLPDDPNPARCLSALLRNYVSDDWCDCPCHRAARDAAAATRLAAEAEAIEKP